MAREFFARCGIITPIANGCAVFSSNGCLIGCTPSSGGGVIVLGGGANSSVRCGVNNTASGSFSGAFGGTCNTASGLYGVTVGGCFNRALGNFSGVFSGLCNTSCVCNAVTISGYYNTVSSQYGNIINGLNNTASGGFSSSIINGDYNVSSGSYSSILNGSNNISSGFDSFIGSGTFNISNNTFSSIINGYTNNSFGCISLIGSGCCNYQSANYGFIGNGFYNSSSSYIDSQCTAYASVVNGVGNNTTGGTWDGLTFTTAPTYVESGCYSFIGNGFQNNSKGIQSFIGNGYQNITCAFSNTIVNGTANVTSSDYSSVFNGNCNTSSGGYSFIANGYKNKTDNNYSSVLTGACNCACGLCSTVINGTLNITYGLSSFIGTGQSNNICLCGGTACYSTVVNGAGNNTTGGSFNGVSWNTPPTPVNSGNYSFIGNGFQNNASGSFSAVLGGCCNVASGSYSGAFGCALTASCGCTWYTNNSCSCGTIASSCLTCNQMLCAGVGGVIQSTNWGYGSFSSSACQPIACNTTAYAMTYDCVEIANGVALQCNSQLKVLQSGVYNLAFSAQVIHVTGGDAVASIWFQCNGCIIPRSNTDVTINGNNSAYVAAWNFMTCMNTNDYLEIYWRASDTDVSLLSCVAQASPTRPETPSIIATLNRLF